MSVNTWQAPNTWEGGGLFELSPQVVSSLSESINPVITYSFALNLSPQVVNSSSVAPKPSLSFGVVQVFGKITASYGENLYTARFAD